MKTHKGIKYAAFVKGMRSFVLIDSKDMVENHPLTLFEFLQSRVEFANQGNVHFDGDIENAFEPVGQPKLLGK